MRIIVDIPEDVYKKALNGEWIGTAILRKMMKNAIIILRSDDFLKMADKKTDVGSEDKTK